METNLVFSYFWFIFIVKGTARISILTHSYPAWIWLRKVFPLLAGFLIFLLPMASNKLSLCGAEGLWLTLTLSLCLTPELSFPEAEDLWKKPPSQYMCLCRIGPVWEGEIIMLFQRLLSQLFWNRFRMKLVGTWQPLPPSFSVTASLMWLPSLSFSTHCHWWFGDPFETRYPLETLLSPIPPV